MSITPNRSLLRSIGLSAVTAALAVAAAGCGSDDDTLSASACDAYADAQAAFFGDPAQLGAAFTAFADAAPEDLADEAQVLASAAAASADDPAAFDVPEVTVAGEAIGDAAFEQCDTVASLDVTGVDYAFADLPESVAPGRVAIRLTNDSATDQPHEIVVVTGTDGQTADELAGLPMEELMQQARPVGVAFAATPGATATTLVDLEAGSYLLICSLPVAEGGEAPATDEPPADTHADHGMVATLTVA